MSQPDAVLTSLGAYVLGALGPAERAQVEEHLGQCSQCREELAELAGLPGLLGRLDQTDLEDLQNPYPQPDNQLVERTLRKLARHRQLERRRNRLLTAAAVVVTALAATAAFTLGSTAPTPNPAAPGGTVSATNTQTGVHAEVSLMLRPWGTALHLVLRGVPPGTHCQLQAVLANGQRQVVGSWRASYEGTASIDAATDASPDQLRAVQVVTDAGAGLLSIPLPSRSGTGGN